MRCAFGAIQLLDEFANTQDNLDGRLEPMFVSNGMDAPTRRRHRSATVEVSATTRSGRSVRHGDYDDRP